VHPRQADGAEVGVYFLGGGDRCLPHKLNRDARSSLAVR
jgi:hypothetical protein